MVPSIQNPHEKKIYNAVKPLFLAFKNDMFFMTHKDIGIRIPADLKIFMK